MLTVGEPARPTEVRRGNAASEPVLRKFRERILSEMRAPWNGEWKTRTDPAAILHVLRKINVSRGGPP
jgi:hypothetical protein